MFAKYCLEQGTVSAPGCVCIYVCGERYKNKVSGLKEFILSRWSFIIYQDRREDVTQAYGIVGRRKSRGILGNQRELPGRSSTSRKGSQKKEGIPKG